MDFKDISSRLKASKTQEAAPEKPMDYAESYQLRGKMVGVLLRDARMSAGRSLEACGRLLRVTPQQVESWEYGDSVPSLPQLEILAYFLDVPVSHFWGAETRLEDQDETVGAQSEYLALRDRMIGVLLHQAREEQALTLDALSAMTAIPVERLQQYELGEIALPMHELTVLSTAVKKNMSYFLESGSHVGQLLLMREQWKYFADLPEDLRQFAAQPLNQGFIEIAIMLSQMPTEKLRRVGESILDITM